MDRATTELISELTYISETDAPFLPVRFGKITHLTAEVVARLAKISPDVPVSEIPAKQFFERLTRTEKWHGDHERTTAKKFAVVYQTLTRELADMKVYRFGTIQIDIYIVGIDKDGRLAGIKTRAVET